MTCSDISNIFIEPNEIFILEKHFLIFHIFNPFPHTFIFKNFFPSSKTRFSADFSK